jgi:hypothetical protein
MDVSAPPRPVQPTVNQMPDLIPQNIKQPLFSASPVTQASKPKRRYGHLLPLARVALIVLAALLLIGGIGRWATAGSTSGNTVAVVAVVLNDGKKMTIQFTADDGLLHKFSAKSQAKLIPGTAIQVAYRPGAADNTVKQVAVVQHAHNLGVALFSVGLLLAIISAVMIFVHKQSTRPAKPFQQAVAV